MKTFLPSAAAAAVRLALALVALTPLSALSAIAPSAGDIIVEARLIEKSPLPSKERLGVYREALVNYLWEIDQVREGRLGAEKILVSHYGIYDTLAQEITKLKPGDTRRLRLRPFDAVQEIETLFISDEWDLDFELPRFHQVDQDLERPKPENRRFDYGKSDYSEKLATLVGLRNQLKLVAVGDSQTAEGLVAGVFYPVPSVFYPVGLNAAIGSQRLNWAKLMVDDYLLDMPQLEWLVIGINPRMFSENKADNAPHEAVGTPGHEADKKLASQGWPMPQERITHDVQSNSLPNRYEVNRLPHLQNTDPKKLEDSDQTVRDRIKKKYTSRDGFPEDWNMSDGSKTLFENLLQKAEKEGYRVFAFIPPINPVMQEFPEVVDEDKTTPEGYDRLVAYLKGLEDEHSHFRFEDINNKAEHFLSSRHFRDTDHLQGLGAMKLAAHIWQMLDEGVEAPSLRVEQDGAEVVLHTAASDAVWLFSDGTILQGAKARHRFARPGTYLVALNGQAQAADGRSGSTWQEIRVPESAFPDGWDETGDEMEIVLRIHEDFARAPRMIFADATQFDDTKLVTWDFGDGTTAAGPFVQHIYKKAGKYTITVKAYNRHGLSKVHAEEVAVR